MGFDFVPTSCDALKFGISFERKSSFIRLTQPKFVIESIQQKCVKLILGSVIE